MSNTELFLVLMWSLDATDWYSTDEGGMSAILARGSWAQSIRSTDGDQRSNALLE